MNPGCMIGLHSTKTVRSKRDLPPKVAALLTESYWNEDVKKVCRICGNTKVQTVGCVGPNDHISWSTVVRGDERVPISLWKSILCAVPYLSIIPIRIMGIQPSKELMMCLMIGGSFGMLFALGFAVQTSNIFRFEYSRCKK